MHSIRIGEALGIHRADASDFGAPNWAVLEDTRHNGRMPKIAAATVAENREQRRDALLLAAANLMQRSGSFTVAEVAREVGLSRSAVYEYYSSAAELIADVLIDELAAWSDALATATGTTAREQVHAWIHGVLDYVIDGRHALLRAAGSVELPASRRAEVQALHQSLIAPLVDALASAGCADAVRQARYVWGVVDVSIGRIESGEANPVDESTAVITFVDGALSAALRS
jgi:AcrR family transcriptional regulator